MDKKPGHQESKDTAANNPLIISTHHRFLSKRRPAKVIGVGQAADCVIFIQNRPMQDFWCKVSSQMCSPLFNRLETWPGTWLSSPWVGLAPVSCLVSARLIAAAAAVVCCLLAAAAVCWCLFSLQSLLWRRSLSSSALLMLMHLPHPTLHLTDSRPNSNPDKSWGAIKRSRQQRNCWQQIQRDCLAECVGGGGQRFSQSDKEGSGSG